LFLHGRGNYFPRPGFSKHSQTLCASRHSLFILIFLQRRRQRALMSPREQEVPMERGLLAPLSPNEQTALRRVANGISQPNHLRSTSVERLKRLALVEETEGRIQLTELGQQRYLADRPAIIAPQGPAA
jgi:hypothetical protein